VSSLRGSLQALNDFLAEFFSKGSAISLRGALTGGKSIPKDALQALTGLFLQHATNPGWILELTARDNFNDAEAGYQLAKEISDRGEIKDYETARQYFEALFIAYANDYSARQLLDQIDKIDKTKLDRLKELGISYLIDLVKAGSKEALSALQKIDPVLASQYQVLTTTVLETDYSLFYNIIDSLKVSPLTRSYNETWDMWKNNLNAVLADATFNARYTESLRRQNKDLIGSTTDERQWEVVEVHSPVELRVYDSQGRITGIVEGKIMSEIPNSSYGEDVVTILFPYDSYRYEVVGINSGSYGIAVTSVTDEKETSIDVPSVSTSVRAVHQYTIDWNTLAKGEKGVTMKVDSNGDGTFEEVKYIGQQGTGFPWVWVAVAGLTGLLGVLVGAFMVWRRIGKKQAAKT